jgi:hypothetical protein
LIEKGRALTALPHLAMLLVIALLFMHFRYFSTPNYADEFGKSFFQFKAAQWISPFFTLLFGVAVILLWQESTSKALQRLLPLPLIVFGIIILNSLIINYETVSTLPVKNRIALGDYKRPLQQPAAFERHGGGHPRRDANLLEFKQEHRVQLHGLGRIAYPPTLS